jgi:protein-S-isoprenylcysteine O-methyltransferase Ste14
MHGLNVKTLNVKTWLGLVFLAVAMGILLFAVAGTVHYWQGWVFLGVFFAASLLITLYLMKYDPALLQRRLAGGPAAEKARTQRLVMLFASIGFVGLLVVPALGYRLGWSQAPLAAVIAGNVLIAVGFFIVFLAFRENSFASARIEIAGDQRVIRTGPYALIRHPQYAGAFLYLLGMPLALGSCWGLLVLVPMMATVIWRLFDEEKLLARELPGYAEYQRKVRSRLIPAIF